MRLASILCRRCADLLALVLITLLVTSGVTGQVREQKILAPVPQQLRAQLIERLNLYVEYQRTRQYEKLYDLFSDTTIARVFKGQDKTQFVAAFKKGDEERTSVRLLKFTPTRVEKTTEDGADLYNIYGKAELNQQGELVKGEVVVVARFQNGNWYFSVIGTVQYD